MLGFGRLSNEVTYRANGDVLLETVLISEYQAQWRRTRTLGAAVLVLGGMMAACLGNLSWYCEEIDGGDFAMTIEDLW